MRQLIEEVPPEHHSETLLMRTTLKELKVSHINFLFNSPHNQVYWEIEIFLQYFIIGISIPIRTFYEITIVGVVLV